ncbi:MAG: dethiobiotin synthase [Planctomycetota bacterium]
MTRTLFITGTGTEIGKTQIASLIAKACVNSRIPVGVYKPVASGCDWQGDRWLAEDAQRLSSASRTAESIQRVCPQCFEAPLAPPQAAEAASTTVDVQKMIDGYRYWLDQDLTCVIVEGAGGLFSPIAEGMLNIDFCKQLHEPELLLVAPNRLGVIHECVSTVDAARHHGVVPSGILLNQIDATPDASVETNAESVQHYCSDVPVLAQIGHNPTDDDAFKQLRRLFA